MSLRRTPFPAFSCCPFACLFPSLSPPLSLSMSLCLCLFGVLFGPGPHDELTMSCVLRVHPCVGPLSLTWHTHIHPSPCPLFCCCCHCAFLSNVSVCLSAVKRALHTFRRAASVRFFHSCIYTAKPKPKPK